MYLFEMDFKDARKRCLKQMVKQARKDWPQCNAIVDVNFNILAMGGVVAIVTTGTAVRVGQTEERIFERPRLVRHEDDDDLN
jgi:uncharacterized protein YbjQ (UPF0145 family)